MGRCYLPLDAEAIRRAERDARASLDREAAFGCEPDASFAEAPYGNAALASTLAGVPTPSLAASTVATEAPAWSEDPGEEHHGGEHGGHSPLAAAAHATHVPEFGHAVSHAMSPEHAAPPAPALASPAVERPLGSLGRPFDPMEVPVSYDTINWPPNYGGVGEPTPTTLPAGTPVDRFGPSRGTFFSPDGVPMESRALAPDFAATGEALPFHPEEWDYTVGERGLAVESGEIAPAFAQPGGGTQFRSPVPGSPGRYASMAALEDAGDLVFEQQRTLSLATADEVAEILEAERIARSTGAPLIAPEGMLPTPSSPDMAQMCEDIAQALAADAEVATAAPAALESVAEPLATVEAASVAESAHGGPGALGRGLGIAGAFGGAMQAGEGIGELLNAAAGDPDLASENLEYGLLDTTAGALAIGSGLGAAGVGGEALACMAAAPVAVPGAALGLAASGHHRRAEEDTWGEPTVDPDGTVHHLTSVDFALQNGSDCYHAVHDAIAEDNGVVGDVAGTVLGGVAGGLVGLGAGFVGFGGDLYGGVQNAVDGVCDLGGWIADHW